MKETNILVVSEMDLADGEKSFHETWGCNFINKTAAQLNEYLDKVNLEEARLVAQRWVEETTETAEPSMDEIIESASLHLAIKAMMADTLPLPLLRRQV